MFQALGYVRNTMFGIVRSRCTCCTGARKSGSELLTEQQGEAALRDIQSSIGQLEEDVKEPGTIQQLSNRASDLVYAA